MLEIQRTVGRFEILQEIGRGGMAVVYLARQTDLDRNVALKELGSFHAADASFAERFVLESRVVGSLNHPNVVTVYEYFEHDGTPYIAMEYVDRGSLRPWIGRLSLAQVAGVFEGVLAGLAHAAKRGIVHRDLKPENLMVTADGTIKIGDFGIAKALNQATVARLLTATGTTVGTPTYMAPEQAMGRDIGPWTDLYSVGIIAYEMLVGRVPFHDVDTPMAILMRHVNEPIPAPQSVRPDLDPQLAAWIERLLAKRPEDRTRSAHHAWDELEEIVITLLGPRWRREARLVEPVAPGVATEDQPLTPAPFDPESDDELVTFRKAPAQAAAAEPIEPPLVAASAEPTVPPKESTPPPVTSFRWPTAERRGRKGLLIGLAAAIAVAALAAGGAALALLGSGAEASPEPGRSTVTVTTLSETRPTETHAEPRPGPLARSTSVKATDTAILARLRFVRARLGSASYRVRDSNLADGAASVLVAQRGLESVIGTNALGGLELRPTAARNRLTMHLSASAGAFTTVDARPSANRRTLLIVATKKPREPPVNDGGGVDSGGEETGGGTTAGGGTTGGGGNTGGGGGGGGGGNTGCGRHRICP